MSYILDALKKSEVERQRAAEQQENNTGTQSPKPPKYAANKRLPVFVSVVLLLVISIAAFVVVQADKDPERNTLKAQSVKDNTEKQKAILTASNQQKLPTREIHVGPKAFKELPFFWEKPSVYRQGIDPFAVSIHVFAPEPSQRILFINNREYKVGEQTKQGPRIVSIEPQGVILSYRGEYFKLPRPR